MYSWLYVYCHCTKATIYHITIIIAEQNFKEHNFCYIKTKTLVFTIKIILAGFFYIVHVLFDLSFFGCGGISSSRSLV